MSGPEASVLVYVRVDGEREARAVTGREILMHLDSIREGLWECGEHAPSDATLADLAASTELVRAAVAAFLVRAVAPAGALPSDAAIAAAKRDGKVNASVVSGMSVEVPDIESAVRAAYAVDFGAAAPRDAPR